MAKDVKRTVDEPHDRLTRICAAMGEAMENHPEFQPGGDRAIILVDSMIEHRGGAQLLGYEDPNEALRRMLEQIQALAKAHDIPLAVMRGVKGQG